MPLVREAFDRIGATLDQFMDGRLREALTVGVVGTFALGWLLPRLPAFSAAHPGVDLRVRTNNNKVDLAGEGLDCAIRFGDGAWHGVAATPLLAAPLAPLCAPALAAGLARPADLAALPLLRSYRAEEWERWFAAAGVPAPPLRGPVFDSSTLMAGAAAAGLGVALLPVPMFTAELAAERLVQPFALAIDAGCYWLTRLNTRPESPAMAAFRTWLTRETDSAETAAMAAPASRP
ncbi:hypothetical protein GCM10007301_00890 [Azorhizobium oxalatiphilum]|uniref:LysR substrate-binding domain-containing protein n=1 Tax=Azorhizobium oxalatiphilum TaxID=980631 RepID=A0A917BJN4_9HYPH|nr:hypothetical protein GCM10007301_00890 [Azorhizobium oxalatiphilum]